MAAPPRSENVGPITTRRPAGPALRPWYASPSGPDTASAEPRRAVSFLLAAASCAAFAWLRAYWAALPSLFLIGAGMAAIQVTINPDPRTIVAHAVAGFWGFLTVGCLIGLPLLKRYDSPIEAQPDGSVGAWRIAEPQRWTVTNTFTF